MKFRLSLMVLFNLSAGFIPNQSLLASASEKEEENIKQNQIVYRFKRALTQDAFERYKNERRYPKTPSYSTETEFDEIFSTIDEFEVPLQESNDLFKVTPSLPVILPKKDADQEIDSLIKSIERLSFVERGFQKDEKVQGVWSHFPLEQISELQQAIRCRTSKCIGSMTMFISSGLAKFLVIDAVPFPTTHMKSRGSSNDRVDHFFDLKEGDEVFTSPLCMFGSERSYAFSKDKTEKKEISFKLVLKRLPLEEEEFLKFSSFHPLAIKPQIFKVVSDLEKCGVFSLTSVHMVRFKDRLEVFDIKDLESISHSNLSIAHVEAHDGVVNVIYAYQEPDFDLDDESSNVYDPGSKAFRYLHVKLTPLIED